VEQSPQETAAQPPAVVPSVPEEWAITTPKRAQQMERVRAGQGNIKHGLLASIPMVCRNSRCPVKQFCEYQAAGEVTEGDRCIKEIGRITEGFDRYLNEFKLDPLDPGARADLIQVEQLVMNETLITRAEQLLAVGNLIEEVEVAMNPQGDVITQPMLHKAAEFLPKLQRRHNEILQLLLATRKDKLAAAASVGINIADFTRDLIVKAQQVAARQELMRQGKLKEAEEMGFQYGINAHMTEDDEPIDAEFSEQPDGS
jgi:hypothetical protein